MKILFYIARRYAFTKASRNVINIINIISSLVLITGSASLFIVLSGFGGLKDISLRYMNASNPDIRVIPSSGKFLIINESQKQQLDSLADIDQYSKVVEERVFLYYKEKNSIAYIKGVDSTYNDVIDIDDYVALGNWSITNYRCVLGNDIATALGVGLFDANHFLKIIVPKPGMQNVTNSSTQPYNQLYTTVSGVYSMNEDIDKKYIYTNITKAHQLLNLSANKISAIEIRLAPNANEDNLRKNLKQVLGEKILIRNRVQQNVSLYKMLNTENIAIYLIFALILIVALFNLGGAILMMIIEKKTNLRTLYSMGLNLRELRRIFLFQGCVVTSISAIIGLLIGLGVCLLQLKYGWLKIGYQQPYPLVVSAVDALLVFVLIFILGLLVSWLTSSRISKKLLS